MLKNIYEENFPKSKKIILDNILSEEDTSNAKYFNSGGWNNNTEYTILIPNHKVYYVYVSNKNTIYQQLVYDYKTIELAPKGGDIYDDSYLKAKNGKWKSFETEIFNPKMPEGKYLVFTKVVTEKGKVFFSDIDTLNYEKPKVKIKNEITNLDVLANDVDIYFRYNIEATGDPRTAIEYVITDFNSQTVTFKKASYDNGFEYECTKKYIDNTLQLFYKKNIRGEDYDPKKPLITIYKKNNTYYAISPLIEEGKTIKLNTKH